MGKITLLPSISDLFSSFQPVYYSSCIYHFNQRAITPVFLLGTWITLKNANPNGEYIIKLEVTDNLGSTTILNQMVILDNVFQNIFAQIKGDGTINIDIAKHALSALNVDKNGLDEMDNKILLTIIDKFKGGPVGISTIATAVGEDGGTIEEVYEPFLIQEGYLMRTPRGREATEIAYKHLGKIKGGSQPDLFE